jgi:signal transduction histidine kinase
MWNAHPLVVDGLLAALLLGLGLVSLRVTMVTLEEVGEPPTIPFWAAALWLVALTAPLAVRRRWPLSSFAAVVTAFLVVRLWAVPEFDVSSVALFASMVSVGVHGRAPWRGRLRVLAVVGLAVALGYDIFVAEVPEELEGVLELALGFGLALNIGYVGAAWLLGDTLRLRHEREVELERRNAELVVERERNARRAVMDERLRIARELHDVVAHHVSVMGVQAGAARRVIDRRPEAAVEALATIEDSSRRAVDDLHRLLGFLRSGEDPVDGGDLAPQPGLDRIAELVETAAVAGLPVTVTVEGSPRRLPTSVDLSAFRLVQEALTNTRKHAAAGRADVVIRYLPEVLELEVVDDGRGPGTAHGTGAGTGNGLLGMRERVALHGGTLEAGARHQGGFRVLARLPVKAAP